MSLDKRYIEIVEDNAHLIDDSMAGFMAKCYDDSHEISPYSNDMHLALALVLDHSGFGYKEIADIITKEEKYFKWSRLDEFNHTRNQTPNNPYGYNAWTSLADLWYEAINSESDLLGLGVSQSFVDELTSYEPEVDFACNTYFSMRFCPERVKPIMKGNYRRDEIAHLGDLYIGYTCDPDKYPESISSITDPHYAICKWDGKYDGEQDLFPSWKGDSLIYVPAVKLIHSGIVTVKFVKTALPREILEKYGLPCTDEIRG